MGKPLAIFFRKYTSFQLQYSRNSIVDYCIVSEDLIEDVIYFHVHDHLPHLSDHAKLPLKLSVSVANFSLSAEKDTTYDMPSSYRWFKDEQINKFMKSPYILDNQKLSIDDAIDSFNGIIYTAWAKSVKKKKNK